MQSKEITSQTVEDVLPAQYFSEISRLLDQLDARPRRTHSPRGLLHRGTLGDFASINCFKSLISGLEDILGPEASAVVCIRAGRMRGKGLVQDWGVGHLKLSVEKLGHLLDAALGRDGTRLCAVKDIQETAGTIRVNVTDTICSINEPEGSQRRCTFTLGAMWGALEEMTGGIYLAEQTRSVLAGDEYDQFTFKPLS